MWRLRKNRRSVCCGFGCLFFIYLVRMEVGKSYDHRRHKEVSLKDSLTDPMTVPFDHETYIAGEWHAANGNFAKHSFNLQACNSHPPDRNIPDSRDQKCQNQISSIPSIYSVSIVISFHSEARSALLRTIVSILNRSPKELLKEIILIDDFSDNELDGLELSKFPKVKIFRNSQRQGLIKSRMIGASKSTGSHIMFLDSHCEVNVDWLPPLMSVVVQQPKALASPIIDVIDPDTFEYKPSSLQLKGGFDWSLNFRWLPISSGENKSSETSSSKNRSPVIPGGLFLVSKIWFDEIGGLDKGLEIWGAENIEISLKTWLCGGEVLSVPCSRIGHVFRKKHPYSFPPNGSAITYLKNSRRIAESWLDDYKYQFYEIKPQARQVKIGSTEEISQIKKKLKCKPFQWYLDNVYPELRPLGKDAMALGQLQQEAMCLESDTSNKMAVTLTSCSTNRPEQEWSFSKSGELHQGSYCVTAKLKMKKPKIYLTNCSDSVKQKWTRRRRLLIFQGMCLENFLDIVTGKYFLTLKKCRPKAFTQQWDFSVELQKWEELPNG